MNKNLSGLHFICPASETKLNKEKPRRALHNYQLNVHNNSNNRVNRAEYASLYPYWKKNPETGKFGEMIDQTTGETIQNKASYVETNKYWL